MTVIGLNTISSVQKQLFPTFVEAKLILLLIPMLEYTVDIEHKKVMCLVFNVRVVCPCNIYMIPHALRETSGVPVVSAFLPLMVTRPPE